MYKLITGLLLLAAGCATPTDPLTDGSDEVTDDDPSELALVGRYLDNWGGEHEITDTMWASGESRYHIAEFDNTAQWVIAQNDPSNEWNPDLYSRFDWHDDGSTLWFCQTAYDQASATDARAVAAPDASDPASTGCSDYPWNELIPVE